ncbi:radial spoke head 1-like protein [Lasius niger]|uniref:Radial spoke head 1-like protein n=1 Tax=Lasius niger TaxID=67767 RepID=A0A0J7L0Y2_LASNI|nr:radial spoke head 1-like protein [Lasius niger]
MCSKTVPGITAIGGTDANMVKGSFGTLTERDTKEGDEGDKSATTEGPFSPRIGILPMWRARCITPYNPELLPPEAVPLQEEASTESLIDDKSEDDIWPKIERDLDYPEGDHDHEEYYQGEASSRIDSP